MIPEKYGDNFSDQPSKKVHMSESDTIEDEIE
jgi:hypothetical protein